MQVYSLPEAVKLLGVPYHRVYYAILTGKVNPLKSGHARLFDDRDIYMLRQHFAEPEKADK